MRCPAIEGIETRRPLPRKRSAARPGVECVAPLLRGLKPTTKITVPTSINDFMGRMRCPAIEGIETFVSVNLHPKQVHECRMRCPAIEGIETPVTGCVNVMSCVRSNALPRY